MVQEFGQPQSVIGLEGDVGGDGRGGGGGGPLEEQVNGWHP